MVNVYACVFISVSLSLRDMCGLGCLKKSGVYGADERKERQEEEERGLGGVSTMTNRRRRRTGEGGGGACSSRTAPFEDVNLVVAKLLSDLTRFVSTVEL